MIRKIIKIDEEKCNGCGACAAACHEGAIKMVNGKAKLIRDDYCDGLGDCLPTCPTNAIAFEEREAPAYDKTAVLAAKKQTAAAVFANGCPGIQNKMIHSESDTSQQTNDPMASLLSQWPVQIKLVPIHAPFFQGADLLIAADCTAYAYGDFHRQFIKSRITLIGCPKLDDIDYSDKLKAIIAGNEIKSITVIRMEVPCCGGIEKAVKQALQNSNKELPLQVITLSIDGQICS